MPLSVPLSIMPLSMHVPQNEIQIQSAEQTNQLNPLDPSQNPNPNTNANTNPIVLKDVPYGCLRGGNKPTYRTYHRGQIIKPKPPQETHNTTLKRSLFSGTTSNLVSSELVADADADPMIQERQRKLREIQENFHNQNQSTQATQATQAAQAQAALEPQKIKNVIKQTTTKKYKLGKAPGSNVVGVLIKNSDTRRKIQEEHGVLRRESIVEIRKYLHDHGLIKVGSDAPPDVLRNIYESAKMTGEISNTNKHVMLHNFIKSDDNDTA